MLSYSYRWENDDRYYIAFVHQDLFGEVILSRYWGRKGTRLGGEKHSRMANQEEVQNRLRSVARVRERHGYWTCQSNERDSKESVLNNQPAPVPTRAEGP